MNIKRHLFSLVAAFLLFFSLTPTSFADGGGPVSIENQNLIVYPVDKETVGIVQIMTITNNGEDKAENLKVYLPEGYRNIEVRAGLNKEKIKKTKKGIIDPTGIKPGQKKKVIVSYQMPMEKGGSQWTIQQAYLTKSINVVVQAGVLSFEASNLVTQSDLFEMNDQQFRRFTRLDLHANTPWPLSFKLLNSKAEEGASGAQAGSKGNGSSNSGNTEFTEDGKRILAHEHGGNYLITAITLIIIVVALSIALIGLKRDGVQLGQKRKKPQRSWLRAEKQNVLHEIGQLEKDYQSELISKNTYETTFKKLRKQLIRINTEVRGE